MNFSDLTGLAAHLRDTLVNRNKKHILLYAYNGTGKTRLSEAFKNEGKQGGNADTLYFNAFTEDLFRWKNDLTNDTKRKLRLNKKSRFFGGLEGLDIDSRIGQFLQKYADFGFKINLNKGFVKFYRDIQVDGITQRFDFIKISRGEENTFIWCFFLAIAELAIDAGEGDDYDWVEYLYIDDPISSLDDNNAIAVASNLAQLLTRQGNNIKTVISSHHTLFFNVMCNELRKEKHSRYFLHKNGLSGYTLRLTDDTPYFHHVASLSELKSAVDSGNIKKQHFNNLRIILDKTSSFFGFNHFRQCISDSDDRRLFERVLDIQSHGNYSIFDPVELNDEEKQLFERILIAFLGKYSFELPTISTNEPATPAGI
jgi:hypothetical protein